MATKILEYRCILARSMKALIRIQKKKRRAGVNGNPFTENAEEILVDNKKIPRALFYIYLHGRGHTNLGNRGELQVQDELNRNYH